MYLGMERDVFLGMSFVSSNVNIDLDTCAGVKAFSVLMSVSALRLGNH